MYKPPNLTDRCWDLLEILSVNGNKGMTTREIIEYSKLMGVYDIPDDVQIVSNIVYEFRKRRKIPLLETIDEKHYLLDSAIAALITHSKSSEESQQKDDGLATPAIVLSEAEALSLDTAIGVDIAKPDTDTAAVVDGAIFDSTSITDYIIEKYAVQAEPLSLKNDIKIIECTGTTMPLSVDLTPSDGLSDVSFGVAFDLAPSIPPESNPFHIVAPYSAKDATPRQITIKTVSEPEGNPPTLGELNAFINAKPDEPEEIEILDVEQTMVKNGKYPPIDKLIEWLDAEMAAKTVFIEDKGRKIALLNKIASFPLFDEEVRDKLHEIAVDLEKLTDIE